MYTVRNFKTKKDLKAAVAAGQCVEVYQPNNFFGTPTPTDGRVYLEGPHYPQPHTWCAQATLQGGRVVSVK